MSSPVFSHMERLHTHGSQGDEDEAGDEGNSDLGDGDVEIGFLVGALADAQQGDLSALVTKQNPLQKIPS